MIKKKIQPELYKAVANVLSVKHYEDAGEWARENRILPSDAAEPGPFNPDRTPYTKEIYRAILNPKLKKIVAAMAAQMAKTDMAMNIIGHLLDTSSKPILIVMPTQELAGKLSKDRFSKMVTQTESLYAKLAKGRMHDLVNEKTIGGNKVYFVWASSANQLCSLPAGFIYLDERDRMVRDVKGEGDPVTLVEARLTTFADKKIFITSTPSIEGSSPIWLLFKSGDAKKWSLKCPFCCKFFIPNLDVFHYDKTKTGFIPYLVCPECRSSITEDNRLSILTTGKYVITNPDAAEGVSSFWVSGLCSPWRTWSEAANAYDQALLSKDQNIIKSCVNTVFGECFAMKTDSIEADVIEKRDYKQGELPREVIKLTCGADVQKDCIYYTVRGWGAEKKSWLIEHSTIYGDTDYVETWEKFGKLISSFFGGKPISLTCVDSGYRTAAVYDFAKRFGSKVVPCKGVRHQSIPIKEHYIELLKAGERAKIGQKTRTIDDSHFKSVLFSQIRNKLWFVYSSIDTEYLKQLTSEQQTTDKNGAEIWVAKGANHYLDCEKLNIVASYLERVDMLGVPIKEVPKTLGCIDVWR